jgi:hypothetical protein
MDRELQGRWWQTTIMLRTIQDTSIAFVPLRGDPGPLRTIGRSFSPIRKKKKKNVSRKFAATDEKLTLAVYRLCWGIEQRGVSGLAKLPDFQKRCRKSVQNGGS